MEIALWGCGNMGQSLARALFATGQGRLAVVFDTNPEAMSEVADLHGAAVVDRADAMLDYSGLRGVIIALPPDLHASATIRAVEAGVDVFVEKPMAVDVAGCLRMLESARGAGVSLMVGQVLRFYEPYRSILRWSAERRFGDLKAVSIWRLVDGRRWDPTHWRTSQARSGGPLLEVGAHELDMLRCLMGDPLSVHCVASASSLMSVDWAEFMSLQIRFTGGGLGAYECGAGSHVGRYGFRMYFEEATLVSEAAFRTEALEAFTTGGEHMPIADSEYSDEHPVEAELRAWLASLRGDAPNAVPGEEGMAVVALAEAAYRSADTARIVPLQATDRLYMEGD